MAPGESSLWAYFVRCSSGSCRNVFGLLQRCRPATAPTPFCLAPARRSQDCWLLFVWHGFEFQSNNQSYILRKLTLQTKYASMLAEKVERHGTHVWLINTGRLMLPALKQAELLVCTSSKASKAGARLAHQHGWAWALASDGIKPSRAVHGQLQW